MLSEFPIVAVGVAIVLLLVLILVFRIHAFIALLISSISVGLLTGMELGAIIDSVKNGMGNALGFIATVIGLGAIFGKILEASGGAESIARSLLKIFGQKRASWAMVVTGFLISIPVFLDVGLVLLIPIVYALARDTKKSLLYYAIPLLAGMAVTHAAVPPTPGPVAVAVFMKADLGLVILFGMIIGFPTAVIAGPVFGKWIAKRIHAEIPDYMDVLDPGAEDETARGLPAFWLILVILGVPIFLMLAGSVVNHWLPAPDGAAASMPAFFPWTWQSVIGFLGHPFIALLIATMLGWYVLGIRRGFKGARLMELSSQALAPAGLIILVTGAGGVFKQVLGDSGAAQELADKLTAWHLAPVVLAYILAALIRLIQGSATVAMMTAGALMAGIAATLSEPLGAAEKALVVLAVAFGGTICSHVNDSGFWLVSRYLGLTEKETLRSWTVMETIVSVVGFGLVLVVSVFV